jgi:hypothetical protein
LEKIASPLVDDCDEPDIERVDEIDDQWDERDRQDIEMLNLLFDAEFMDFTNHLSACKIKNKTLYLLSVPLELTPFVKISIDWEWVKKVQSFGI